MPIQPVNIESIYSKAVAKTTEEQRSAYLDSVCAGKPRLRARVAALLKAHDRAGQFLETPPPFVDASTLDESLTEVTGDKIGRYKLLEKIGEGGMAVVYMAEQEEPIRRKVALKIIKLGMDTKSVVARFEAERQALAMMDHPHIAKVLDGGSTETGRPYFVMELVQGMSITEYCNRNRLGTRERLDLFVQVCNAVRHAHQKGIIHRDIKPSNVMVTMHDGRPVPKVIDFGIAKATDKRLTEKTLFTRYAHIVGTPAYMSPEQAELSELDIDTRSDIYSLGVLLYELLTGTTPFSEEELRKAGYLKMQQVICNQEPVKPSNRLTTLGEILTEVATQRSSNPDLLTRAIRGDLDWIVMKTLEKDRTRRYETANALVMDIQRHLNSEPILARSPRAMYCLRKFLHRRHSEIAAALAIGVMFMGTIVILSMWNQNSLQRHRDILSEARGALAEGNNMAALEIVEPILSGRHVGPEAKLLYAGILAEAQQSEEKALSILKDLLNEKPEIAGAAHSLCARILSMRMDWRNHFIDGEGLQEIREHQRKAQELLPNTAEAYFMRAMMALEIKEKLELLDKALDLDGQHYESHRLRAFTYYASTKYEQMKDDAVAMTVLRGQDPLGYALWAIALRELSRNVEAVEKYNEAIGRTTADNPQQIELIAQLCEVHLSLGEYDQVIEQANRGLRDSSDEPILHFRVICAMTAQGRYEDATARYRRIVNSDPEFQENFRDWSMKYVFDAMHAGRPWHAPDRKPEGIAFMPMLEAEETHHHLSASGAHQLIGNGFGADWSPHGNKLAFSLGVHGYSGLATLDLASGATELLIVPGRDPRWSPDGDHIAFVRDCQILQVAELTADRSRQYRPFWEEEVWIIEADGTGAKRLTSGSWPSWSQDSKHVYYHSDKKLRSVPIEAGEAQPEKSLKCSSSRPIVSPDGSQVAYVEGESLKIVDLASQSPVAECVVPPRTSGAGWAPSGQQFGLVGLNDRESTTGLWIYDLNTDKAAKVLDASIGGVCWSPDERALAFSLGPPLYEIWQVSLDPNVSTIEALGPGSTIEEHYRDVVKYCTGIIDQDPADALSLLKRALYYSHYLHDREKALADLDRYIALAHSTGETNSSDHWFRDLLIALWESTPENVGLLINTVAHEAVAGLSDDGLSLFLDSNRIGGRGWFDIWSATRPKVSDPWDPPVNLGEAVNTEDWDGVPSVSADGLSLFLSSWRPGGLSVQDIWMSTRRTKRDLWSEPVNLGPKVNSAYWELTQSISADGRQLHFGSNRPGGFGDLDIWVTTRATTKSEWGTPVNLGPTVNSPNEDMGPVLSADGLLLFFTSERSGGYGGRDIWLTRRATTEDPWTEPVNLGPAVNTSAHDQLAVISHDGSTLYFSSDRFGTLGGLDIWKVPIPFRSDGFPKHSHSELAPKQVAGSDRKEVMR